MSGVSESINFLFNVLICGSFRFQQKIKIIGCLEKTETTIQSSKKSDIIDLILVYNFHTSIVLAKVNLSVICIRSIISDFFLLWIVVSVFSRQPIIFIFC
jgi:hypothetical protein